MPSRLITYTGGVAAPMNMSDSEGARGRSSSALSVSRSSIKINKNLRRAVTQPRPAPQVYKTEPGDFRSLVQQLTGTSPPAESSPILTPKPLNPRLSKIAPPPLRPVFSYPGLQQPVQQQNQSGFNPGPRRFNSFPAMTNPNPLTPQRPLNSVVPPLSFSPLPALSPADQIWANIMTPLESPGSAAMRQLTQMMAGGNGGEAKRDGGGLTPLIQPHITSVPNSNFPQEFSRFSGSQSLRYSPPFNSPFSPGMPSGYGQFNGFGGQFSPTATLAMDYPFSFPDSDISRSAFS